MSKEVAKTIVLVAAIALLGLMVYGAGSMGSAYGRNAERNRVLDNFCKHHDAERIRLGCVDKDDKLIHFPKWLRDSKDED